MDYFELLTKCGFSKKEAAVYLALLENGPLTLSKISHHTHINRPALYTLLPALSDLGVVSIVKNGKRNVYCAEPVEKVELLYSQQHKEIEKELQEFKAAYTKIEEDRPRIKYFEGEKGLIFVFDDVAMTLPRGGAFYRYTARTGPTSKKFKNTLYTKLRNRKQIERFAITGEDKASAKKPKLNRHIRIIPKDFDLFDDDVSLLIYADKTAYVDYSSKTTFIIESQKIARFQEKLFKLLWKKLK